MSLSAKDQENPPGRPAAVDDAEQRTASRYTPLIRTAKIRCATGEAS